jgi:hypothetical protein
MLLSNLTSFPVACTALISLKIKVIPDDKKPGAFYPTQSRSSTCPIPDPYPSGEEREQRALPLLIDAFLQAAESNTDKKPEKKREGNLHFLASVFANLTAVSKCPLKIEKPAS